MRADAELAGRYLEELVEQVVPLVRRTVRQQLLGPGGFHHTTQEVEDVQGDAVAAVLARLRDLREGFNSEPIENLAAYVTTVARNACHRCVRSRRPNRARLKNRLRYLFGHDPTLALWQEASGEWMCGLARRRGVAGPDAHARLRAIVEDQAGVRAEASAAGTLTESRAARVIARRLPGGIDLDTLAGLVASVMGIVDSVPTADTVGESLAERAEATEPSVLATLVARESLERLWSEVLELPVRQRTALLLNLRDDEGHGVLASLPLTGVSTLRAIAEALEMPPRELASLWHTLPLEDARIAERLGVSRQQVINFRKSARERLARRLGRWR